MQLLDGARFFSVQNEEMKMENQKKEFDSTVSFMFFSDWLEAIEDAETETDRESEAYMLFKAIANYSLFNEEPDFEGCKANRSFKRFWPMLSRQIDSSIRNRKRGFRDTNGPTEAGKKVIEAYTKNPQASLRKIASIAGVSKSEVDRVRRKYLSDGSIPVPGAIPVPNAIPTPNTYTNTNTGTGHGTGRDTGQPELPSHFGEFGDSMGAGNSPEAKPQSVVDWYKKELEHWRKITPFGGIESRILAHYLSTHKETPLEKKFGDRYGRYITGWDSEKGEPIIGYRFGYVPLELLKHNIADIPREYAASNWWVGLEWVSGGQMIIPGVPDDDVDNDDDLPW